MEITRIPLTRDELECAVDLTERLVKLRQNECKHLCVENVGPEIYRKLLAAHYPPLMRLSGSPQIGPIELGDITAMDSTAP